MEDNDIISSSSDSSTLADDLSAAGAQPSEEGFQPGTPKIDLSQYDVRYVLRRAEELRRSVGQRNARMDRYERMYKMDVWDQPPQGSDDVRLSLPIAFDLVEKMRALLITRPPVINVPWSNTDPDAQERAQKVERYLYGAASRMNLGRVLADAEWFAMCLGKTDVKLVYDPNHVEGDSPLVAGAPDPRTLYGFLNAQHDRYVELAHMWERSRREIIDEWGVTLEPPPEQTLDQRSEWLDQKVEYIEYWLEVKAWANVPIKPKPLKPARVMEMTVANVTNALHQWAGVPAPTAPPPEMGMGQMPGPMPGMEQMPGAEQMPGTGMPGAMPEEMPYARSVPAPLGTAPSPDAEDAISRRANQILVDLQGPPKTKRRRVRRIVHTVVVRDSGSAAAGHSPDGGIVIKRPVVMPGYPFIPYVKWSGIATPLPGENADLSVLYPLANGDNGDQSMGVLEAWNQLASLDLVEAINAANPPLKTDDKKASINTHAGEVSVVEKDHDIGPLRQPGQSLAFQRMSEQMKAMVDRVGLPEVWSGMVQNLSGQAISGLATAFTMMIGFKQADRERALEQLMQLVLALTREWADPEEGWHMYGANAYGKDVEQTVKPDEVDEHTRVRVKLSASMPKDDIAFVSMLMQLVNNDLLSYETALDHIQKVIGLASDTPEEEIERILRAKLMLKSDLSQVLAKLLARRSARRLLANAGEDPALVDQLMPLPGQQQPAAQGLPPGPQGPGGPPMQNNVSQSQFPPTMGLPPNVLPPSPELLAAAGRMAQGNNMEAGRNIAPAIPPFNGG